MNNLPPPPIVVPSKSFLEAPALPLLANSFATSTNQWEELCFLNNNSLFSCPSLGRGKQMGANKLLADCEWNANWLELAIVLLWPLCSFQAINFNIAHTQFNLFRPGGKEKRRKEISSALNCTLLVWWLMSFVLSAKQNRSGNKLLMMAYLMKPRPSQPAQVNLNRILFVWSHLALRRAAVASASAFEKDLWLCFDGFGVADPLWKAAARWEKFVRSSREVRMCILDSRF